MTAIYSVAGRPLIPKERTGSAHLQNLLMLQSGCANSNLSQAQARCSENDAAAAPPLCMSDFILEEVIVHCTHVTDI